MSKICPECKAEFDDNMNFCPECGSRLEDKVEGATLVSIGDANAISGGVHIQDSHNVTNYDNSVSNVSNVSNVTNNVTNIVNKRTQEEIRLESMNMLRKEAEVLMEHKGHINSGSMGQLQLRGKELGLGQADLEEIVRDTIASNIKNEELNEAGERILANAKEAIKKNDVELLLELEKRMESIASISIHDEVQFMYFLILALSDSDKLIKLHNEQVSENYWRTFWTIAQCICSNDFDNASKLLVSFSPSRFGKPQADLTLLETVLCIKEGKNNDATEILGTIEENPSDMLEPMLYAVRTILEGEECSRLDALFFKQFLEYFEDEEVDDDTDEQEEYIIDDDPNAPYDPHKDLPLYKIPSLSLLSQFVNDGKNISVHSLLSGKAYTDSKMELPCYIGKSGKSNVCFDLTRAPHLLIEGKIKDEILNVIFSSLVFKKHPAELKFVLLGESKESNLYEKVDNHFLARLKTEKQCVVFDIQKIVKSLDSLCKLMDMRNLLLKRAKCKNVVEYNSLFQSRRLTLMDGHDYMPYFVVVIPELDDVIMPTGREIEKYIYRLANAGHSVGIHVLAATQVEGYKPLSNALRDSFPLRVHQRHVFVRGGNRRENISICACGKESYFELACLGNNDLQNICEYIQNQQGYQHPYYLPNVTFNSVPLSEPAVIIKTVIAGSVPEPILQKECIHRYLVKLIVINAKGHNCRISLDANPFISKEDNCSTLKDHERNLLWIAGPPFHTIEFDERKRSNMFCPNSNYMEQIIEIGYYYNQKHLRQFDKSPQKRNYTIMVTSDKGLYNLYEGNFTIKKIKHLFFKDELRILEPELPQARLKKEEIGTKNILYYIKAWFRELLNK